MTGPTRLDTVEGIFERAAREPLAWQLVARELVYAANLLYKRYTEARPEELLKVKWPPPPIDLNRFHASGRPVLLLYGLAIENLIKAVLISEGHSPVQNRRLNTSFKTHDLTGLFRAGRLSLRSDVEKLLKRLQAAIESGKYPIPTQPAPVFDDAISRREFDLIHRVLEGLESALHALSESRVKRLPKTDLRLLGVSPEPILAEWDGVDE